MLAETNRNQRHEVSPNAVALPGWIIFGLAALVGVIGLAAGTADTEQFGAPELVIVVLMALFGVVIAVPGTIVFNKCKRR